MPKKLVPAGRPKKHTTAPKAKVRPTAAVNTHRDSGKSHGQAHRAKSAAAKVSPTRPKSGARPAKKPALAANGRLATLKERIRRLELQNEPPPTLVESEAVGYLLAAPDLMDEVRELAFLELAIVVERKLKEHGRPLTRLESANVAWRILGR
ncbi:MAG TPA: hypothetical protein VGG64_06045 [Pirellulales bacterium]|jgi:hypothetical protein